jgi:hypothetical protein
MTTKPVRAPWLVPAAALAAAVGLCAGRAEAQAGPSSASEASASGVEKPLVRASQMSGRLEGLVVDDRGVPLAGVAVTAQGVQLEFALTDRQGRFVFDRLPAGPYLVRAHLPGYAASRRELVEVLPAASASRELRLVRLAGAGDDMPVRPVLAAGLQADPRPAEPEDEPAAHDHGATAWRIRHLKRSILRETTEQDLAGLEEPTVEGEARAGQVAGPAVLSFLADLPITAQVQFLTTSAFDGPADLFSGTRRPKGVAFVSVTAPLGAESTWAVQGAVTEGDLASWILGGSYATRLAQAHQVDVGMTYAAQRYDGGNPLALAAMGEVARTVGAVHAYDRWAVSRALDIKGGASIARYGYLERSPLFSPSIEVRWAPGARSTIRARAAQRMTAPGAEEFVPSLVGGLWLPPQRTFAPLVPSAGFRPERTRHVEVAVEREVASFVIGARRFHQLVSDQVVTLFGFEYPDRPRADLGHYFTATAGNFEATGWGVSISRPVASRLRGSVEYSVTRASWLTSPDTRVFAVWARSAVRPARERVHDVTTMVETEIPETATRVYALYRLNTGYTRGDSLESDPALSGRFDVQVTQRLPFLPLGNAEWEILVGVRNLFREPLDGGSVYDELLVVRPPKRIVGGLMVRF